MGLQFEPLVNACEYALAPEYLPNLVCSETIQRSARGSALDTIEAEVRLVDGVESYTSASANGKTSASPDWSGGWRSNALFGGVLTAVFYPKTKTKFTLAKDSSTSGAGFSHYNFSYIENLGPAFNVAGENPPMTGSIWVNRKTGQLAQLETIAHPDPRGRLQGYHSVIDYNFVPIAPLGLVLVPVKADVQACLGATCYRNVATFHDCRKFGTESKIVPGGVQ